jgi:hypothetical protein
MARGIVYELKDVEYTLCIQEEADFLVVASLNFRISCTTPNSVPFSVASRLRLAPESTVQYPRVSRYRTTMDQVVYIKT